MRRCRALAAIRLRAVSTSGSSGMHFQYPVPPASSVAPCRDSRADSAVSARQSRHGAREACGAGSVGESAAGRAVVFPRWNSLVKHAAPGCPSSSIVSTIRAAVRPARRPAGPWSSGRGRSHCPAGSRRSRQHFRSPGDRKAEFLGVADHSGGDQVGSAAIIAVGRSLPVPPVLLDPPADPRPPDFRRSPSPRRPGRRRACAGRRSTVVDTVAVCSPFRGQRSTRSGLLSGHATTATRRSPRDSR